MSSVARDRRAQEWDLKRGRRVVEEARVPEVVGHLAAELGARQECMTDASRGCAEEHIRLIEHVRPLRGVVVDLSR
jgi:hypothetical protein